MIGQQDTSNDSILTGDGYTFPYLNWSLIEGIDFTGDGTEDNFYEWLIPSFENMRFIFKGVSYVN